jgi:hypothetical protein
MLFGRCGLRVANIPTFIPLPRGGRIFVFDRFDQALSLFVLLEAIAEEEDGESVLA